MNDLIRQAADEYPLKISGSDWDKVLSGIPSAMQTQLSEVAKVFSRISKR